MARIITNPDGSKTIYRTVPCLHCNGQRVEVDDEAEIDPDHSQYPYTTFEESTHGKNNERR